jgi:hypothetical protein
MTKTHLLTFGGGRDHLADFDVPVGDHHPIKHQLDHLAFLLKASVLQTLVDAMTPVLNRLYHARQLPLAVDTGFQLACLAGERLRTVSQILLASAIFFQLQDASQLRLGEPLLLLFEAPVGFPQVFAPGLELLGQPGTALCPSQRLFNQGGVAQECTDSLPHDLIQLVGRNEASWTPLIPTGLDG